MSNAILAVRIDKVMSDVKKTLYKVECLRGNIGNLVRVGIPNGDPTNIKPFLQERIYPKIEEISTELNSLIWKLDAVYAELDKKENDSTDPSTKDIQKYQNLINEVDEILKQHKEKYGEC
jgi:hypothetical protein